LVRFVEQNFTICVNSQVRRLVFVRRELTLDIDFLKNRAETKNGCRLFLYVAVLICHLFSITLALLIL
jgi:hypothetical protein